MLGIVPPELDDPRLWRRERNHTDADGEIHRTRILNAGGLLLTLHDGRALQAERSLPKALTGQNISDLAQGDVPDAIAAVDDEIAEALGDGLPSFGDWLPVRVDYCESIPLGDEGRVLRTLRHLSGVELPYKGLPVVGQSHSVTWAKGAVRLKVYSKFLESRSPAALGVLRQEAGVIRARSFRMLLERLASAAAGEPAMAGAGRVERDGLTVLTVLRPEMHAAALGQYADRLRGAAMSADEIGDLELLREMTRFFGVRRAATILGYCALYAANGAQSRRDILGVEVGSLPTRYRVLSDIRAFHEHLALNGWTQYANVIDDRDEASLVRWIADAAARSHAA